jgi:hypothetical protein
MRVATVLKVLCNAVVLTEPLVNTWRQGRTYFPEARLDVAARAADATHVERSSDCQTVLI